VGCERRGAFASGFCHGVSVVRGNHQSPSRPVPTIAMNWPSGEIAASSSDPSKSV
jgi:hypothetical protein